MSFVGICQVVYFPDLTFLQSWFMWEGNVVFFSDMILLRISTFDCSSWVNVFVYVIAVYRSLSCSVWFGVSGFPVFSVSVTVLGVCWCFLRIYLFVNFLCYKVWNPSILCYCSNLVGEPFIRCLKSHEFFSDFYNSFSIPSFCRVAPKITV